MKQIRFIQLTLISAVFLFSAAAAQPAKMTLQQCIDSALKNNIDVLQAALQADAATVNVKQAKANMLPDLNGSFGYGLNKGRNVDPLTNGYINQQLASSNAGLSSGMMLFNGMRLQNLVKQNNFAAEGFKMDLQQAKDNLTLNVILAYLQVLSNEDIVTASKAQEAVTKKQVERMTILVNEGAAANYQLADLKGQLASEQIAVINASNALQQAKLSLCQWMNMDYLPGLELDRTGAAMQETAFTASAADVYQSSLQNFAAVKASLLKEKSAAKAIEVSRAGFFPVLRLSANLGSSYSSLAQTLTPTNITEVPAGGYVVIGGNQNPVLQKQQNFTASKTGYVKQLNNNLGTFAGISLQVPLFNSFQTRNNIKLAKISYQNAQLVSANTKRLLHQNIEQAHLNMTAAYDRYKVLTEQVKDFEESFRAAEVRFGNGVINSAEYLISKNNLDRTRISLSQAKYEYSFRVAVLNYYKGK